MKGQVSLEYLLILAAFFSALAIALPAISYATNQFQIASDTILAKNIADQLTEQVTLFEFLADGSSKTIEFVPAKEISFLLQNSELIISSSEKDFILKINSAQNLEESFNSKFFITIKKQNNKIELSFSQSK